MIIDGKLIVSKKKKAVLVAELRQKGFQAFPTLSKGGKAAESEQVLENDENDEDDESVKTGVTDYNYLLGVSSVHVFILRHFLTHL